MRGGWVPLENGDTERLFVAAGPAGSVPWAGMGLAAQSEWTWTLPFGADPRLGPTTTLTLYRTKPVQVELPFEFRDVPLL
jgi:hypothetical protein